MKKIRYTIILLFLASWVWGQQINIGNNKVIIPAGIGLDSVIKIAAGIAPSERQLKWQELEGTAFIHFGMNTFYDQEWGKGTEDPARFNPSALNANQWVSVMKEAGQKLVILTCKHHDGFCLWPSRFTDHTVASSPWKNGKGDVVKELSDACHSAGVKFGVYLSPWDRHEPSYGDSPKYNRFFLNQLTELLSNYGTIDEVWFDGACGEGPNGKKQVYDWASYYNLIRKLQPGAVISIMGPDVRWVGTESGYGRETEWSVVPIELANQDSIASGSQQSIVNEGFIPHGDMMNNDLGSREKIGKAKTLVWYPSEVDVSIRPGWFWHKSEDERVKTPEKLLDIYFSSAGRNSLLLLNIPPDNRGLITDYDAHALREMRSAIVSIFSKNLLKGSVIKGFAGGFPSEARLLLDGKNNTHWMPDEGEKGILEFDMPGKITFDVILLQENIRIGQRVEKFHLEALQGGTWTRIAEGTTVGYKRLLRIPVTTASKLRLVIDQSRLNPAIAEFGIYKNNPEASASPGSKPFTDSLSIRLQSSGPGDRIFYTTDGSIPSLKSKRYLKPIKTFSDLKLNYISYSPDGRHSFCKTSAYTRSNYGITFGTSPSAKYAGGNALILVDGKTGSKSFADGRWLGFEGTDLDVTVDLGAVKDIQKISTGFLEDTQSWIFFPSRIKLLTSADGISFVEQGKEEREPAGTQNNERMNFSVTKPLKARYIRVMAGCIKSLPGWHANKGEPGWIFVDEIYVE